MPSAAADCAVSPRRRSTSVSPGGEVVGHLAVLTVGGDDEHHAVPLGVGPRHRAAGRQRLVVGMGVEADERAHSGLLDRAGLDELVDPRRVDAPVGQHLARVLSGVGR